jgi:hypothetical protein
VRIVAAAPGLFAAIGLSTALAQNLNLPSNLSVTLEGRGGVVTEAQSSSVQVPSFDNFEQSVGGIPTNQLSKFAQTSISEVAGGARSPKTRKFIELFHRPLC